jgi:hypothetical protein
MIWELLIDFDILDGFISAYPPGYAPGFVDLEREAVTPTHTVYKLSQGQLGDVGEIKLSKLGEKRTKVCFYAPPYIAGDGKQLHQRRKEHHRLVMQAFFDRLKHSRLIVETPKAKQPMEMMPRS